jgi:hypothetical protein
MRMETNDIKRVMKKEVEGEKDDFILRIEEFKNDL